MQYVPPHDIDNSVDIYLLYLMYMNFVFKKVIRFIFFCFMLSKGYSKEVSFEVNASTAETILGIEAVVWRCSEKKFS